MQQLQQAFGHRRRASACVCVTTTCNYNLSLRLPFFSQSHSVTFPPFLFFFLYHPSCFAVCVHRIHNPVHLSVFTTHVDAPCWRGIRRRARERSGLHFSARRQTSFGLFVNIRNEIRCRGCLSLKIGISQPCARINPGYILLSHRPGSVSIPNCIQSLLNKNKGLFYSH